MFLGTGCSWAASHGEGGGCTEGLIWGGGQQRGGSTVGWGGGSSTTTNRPSHHNYTTTKQFKLKQSWKALRAINARWSKSFRRKIGPANNCIKKTDRTIIATNFVWEQLKTVIYMLHSLKTTFRSQKFTQRSAWITQLSLCLKKKFTLQFYTFAYISIRRMNKKYFRFKTNTPHQVVKNHEKAN